jgi:antitoxin (DNA-binding transcriptional repressor) of toxin-antitoxin stability system
MRTATITDLQKHFRRVASWIEQGETVQILRRGKVFAELTPVSSTRNKTIPAKLDIMAQLHEVWGDRMFSMEEVRAMREAELGCSF